MPPRGGGRGGNSRGGGRGGANAGGRPVSAKQKKDAMKAKREQDRLRAQQEEEHNRRIKDALARGEMPREVAIWRADSLPEHQLGMLGLGEDPAVRLRELEKARLEKERRRQKPQKLDSRSRSRSFRGGEEGEASELSGASSEEGSDGEGSDDDDADAREAPEEGKEVEDDDEESNVLPDNLKAYVPGDLRTVFARESKDVLEERKLRSQLPLDRAPLDLVDRHGGIPAVDYFNDPIISLPQRPDWDPSWSKEQLESAELDQFQTWLREVYSAFPGRLNYFEHNLEVWRQLWRTIERSDVLLCLADSRNPLLNFPPALYDLITRVYQKPAIVILNKVDLVTEARAKQWMDFFALHFPDVPLVPYTSHPYIDDKRPYYNPEEQRTKVSMSRQTARPFGAEGLLEQVRKFVRDQVSDEVWEKISFKPTHVTKDRVVAQEDKIAPRRSEAFKPQKDKPFVTIGMLGPPNAGKSTFVNSLARRKLVSVSRTPGHTKHLQTMFLNPVTCLCDCPGLVFPAADMPRPLQVLFGLFPIAQLREPYSTIQYLSERVRLEDEFGLRKVYSDRPQWSGWEICEAYAVKKNFRTQKGGLDAYRAANEMLRRLHEGNRAACFSYIPPLGSMVEGEPVPANIEREGEVE